MYLKCLPPTVSIRKYDAFCSSCPNQFVFALSFSFLYSVCLLFQMIYTHTHTNTRTHARMHARIHTYAIHPWSLVFTVGCFGHKHIGHRKFRSGEHHGKVPFWLSMESKNRQSENKYNEPSANRWLCWSYGGPGKAISRQKQRLIWRGVGSTTEVTYVWRGRVLLRQKSCHPPS